MEMLEIIKLGGLISVTGISCGVCYIQYKTYKLLKNRKDELEEYKKATVGAAAQNDLYLERAKELRIKMFNELLTTKFHYYFTSEILAHFLQNVALKREKINELKEHFYIDVSKAMNEKTRDNLLEIYSVQGIKMYIHQTFLRMLNDANVKYTDENDLSRDALKAVYDINSK